MYVKKLISLNPWYSETSLNQTQNKTESCIIQTPVYLEYKKVGFRQVSL